MSISITQGDELPRLVFVPNAVFASFGLTNSPIHDLLDLQSLLDTFGVVGLANFIFANSLYNSESDTFLKTELLTGFDRVDLYEVLYQQAITNPGLHDQILDVKRNVEGLQLGKTKPTEQYLKAVPINDMQKDTDAGEKYYVPHLFVIRENVYGVRLTALTGLSSPELEMKKTTVANIGVLANRYNTQQLAQMPIFSQYIRLC